MAGWRVLRSVVDSFLSTFSSRYNDYNGWWTLGQIERNLSGISVDLLGSHTICLDANDQFICCAQERFRTQLQKHQFDIEIVAAARLDIEKLEEKLILECGLIPRAGHFFLFKVRVTTNKNHHINRTHRVFVAPHDPTLERRRRME